LVPKSSSGLSPRHGLDRPSSQCLLTKLEFRCVADLPTQSYVCVLGALLAVLDLDELASRPDTDELVNQPSSNGTALVMDIGLRLLNLVSRWVACLSVLLILV